MCDSDIFITVKGPPSCSTFIVNEEAEFGVGIKEFVLMILLPFVVHQWWKIACAVQDGRQV